MTRLVNTEQLTLIHHVTTNPSVLDDYTANYRLGNIWINTSTTEVFNCVDTSAGDATWRRIVAYTPTGSTSEDLTVAVTSGTIYLNDSNNTFNNIAVSSDVTVLGFPVSAGTPGVLVSTPSTGIVAIGNIFGDISSSIMITTPNSMGSHSIISQVVDNVSSTFDYSVNNSPDGISLRAGTNFNQSYNTLTLTSGVVTVSCVDVPFTVFASDVELTGGTLLLASMTGALTIGGQSIDITSNANMTTTVLGDLTETIAGDLIETATGNAVISGGSSVSIKSGSTVLIATSSGVNTPTFNVTNDLTASYTTASRALYVDASKIIKSSITTSTELDYLSGVTSAIQTQLNSKSSSTGSSSITTVGTLTSGTWHASTIDDSYLTSSYALLAGRSGGQSLIGGTGASENLTLTSTSHGTKGKVVIGSHMNYQSYVPYFTEYDNGNSGATKTIDWNNGIKQKITMSAACSGTFTAPAGPSNLTLFVTQGGSGSYTMAWPNTVKWPAGTAPTLSTASGSVDIISFYYNGNFYYGDSSLSFS